MDGKTRKFYLERNGMACAICFGPDLELKLEEATAEVKDNLACMLVPVKCHICGWKGQETYSLSNVNNLQEDDEDEGCFRAVKG